MNPIAPLPSSRYLPRGLVARLAVQCTHPESGLTGSWLFGGDSWRELGAAATPLFADCYDLFRWLKVNGWEQTPDSSPTLAYTYRPVKRVWEFVPVGET